MGEGAAPSRKPYRSEDSAATDGKGHPGHARSGPDRVAGTAPARDEALRR